MWGNREHVPIVRDARTESGYDARYNARLRKARTPESSASAA